MKKKLSLSEIRVQSFQTDLEGGLNADQPNTKHSGICTCLMFCNSEPELNCTQVCIGDAEQVYVSKGAC